ncbi:MAG: calcium-binding protein [Waterburya sp.]
MMQRHLISNGDDAVGFVNGINGDLVGSNGDDPFNPQSELLIDPRLGNLQDNGGLTETFALLEDSPAIDAGSNPNNLTTDQRGEGFNRTVGNGTDIGALEVQTIISAAEIIGTPGNDFLQGSGENDRIQGLDGKDVIQGLDGNDFLSGDNDNDFIEGGNGDDDVIGGEGNDLLNGGNDNDVVIGGEGNDRIFAGNGNDTIDDGAGNDILFGDAGSDRFVNSNSGNDLLIGGDDRDLFIFNLNPGAGFFDRDRIIDFQTGTDVIGFRPVVDAPQSFDNFDDLDTDGSGILDELDQRVMIIGSSTAIDFSDLFGRPFNSDTITLVGATDLSSDDFLFATTI